MFHLCYSTSSFRAHLFPPPCSLPTALSLDIYITIQPPSSFVPANALIQLGVNTSQTVQFLKEKIQDSTGIPMTQQKLMNQAGTETLAGDHAKLLSFNVIEGTRLTLQYEYLTFEAAFDTVPKAVRDQFAGVMGDQEVVAFLTMVSVSPSLQTLVLQKLSQVTQERFLRWARDSGSHFRAYYGRAVDYVVVTPQRVEGVRIMLQRLSKELGLVAASGKSKLRKELSSQGVTLYNKEVDTHQSEVVDLYARKKYARRSPKNAGPEELLAVRLFSLPKFEIQPLFSQSIETYLKDVTSEGTLKLRSAEEKERDEKEKGKEGKEKERETWKHSLSHLCKATSDLRGVQGRIYRGHPTVTPDLEQLRPGGVVTFPSFTPCLTHLDAARKMAGNRVMFEISVTREFGCLVKDYSYYRIEHEVLLPPFACFRVSSVERDYLGSALHIRLECCFIPPAIAPLLPPIPPLSPDEERARQKADFFLAITEGNALFFLHNKKIPADFAKEKNERGQTPLHVAARHSGSEYVMVWLLVNGADVNATDLNGSTPLHLSVAAKQKSLTKILLQRGALLDVRNLAGKVPRDENPDFLTQLMAKLKMEKVEEPDTPVLEKKSKSQEFEESGPPRRTLVSSHSELPLGGSSSPASEAIEMRSQCLKQIAALEKAEMLNKTQSKSVRMKIMKEDVNVIAACQAYDNDLQLLAETLVEYLELTG